MVPDLQGAETDTEPTHGGAEVQEFGLFRCRLRRSERGGKICWRTHAVDANHVQGCDGNRPLGGRYRTFIDRRAVEYDALSDRWPSAQSLWHSSQASCPSCGLACRRSSRSRWARPLRSIAGGQSCSRRGLLSRSSSSDCLPRRLAIRSASMPTSSVMSQTY